MKKILLFFLGLLCFTSAFADNDCYFTMGINDTLWVNPYTLGYGKIVPVHAIFNGRLDSWTIIFTYPTGMSATRMSPRNGMRIPYINSAGDTTTLAVPLGTLAPDYTYAGANIWQNGYWFNNGNLESYGTVKWEAGYYDRMFDIQLEFDNSFVNNFVGDTTIYISVNSYMTSGSDARGGTIGYPISLNKLVTVLLGYIPGDVNGDDVLNTADVTALIAYIMGNIEDWDQYQIAAADVNHDGYINVADTTYLIAIIMNS